MPSISAEEKCLSLCFLDHALCETAVSIEAGIYSEADDCCPSLACCLENAIQKLELNSMKMYSTRNTGLSVYREIQYN